MKAKTRDESAYRNAISKDGRFSPHLCKEVTERISNYCKFMDINKTKFVETCVIERLDDLEKEMLNDLSREELIEIIMQNRKAKSEG